MAFETSDWDSKSYQPGYNGVSFPEPVCPASSRENTRKMKEYGLWNSDDECETPYSDEVEVSYFGSKGARSY